MAEEDRRERKGEPPAVLGGCRPPPGVGAIRGDDVGIVPRRFVNVAPMSEADGGDLLLSAIVGAKHLEEEPARVGGEIRNEDRTGDEARDGDQEDAGEPSQATWHASMVPADLMGHKSVAPASEGSVERASPGEELRCRPAYAAGGGRSMTTKYPTNTPSVSGWTVFWAPA